ncbi:MAG: HAD-IA family hydrolase [Methylophaga sp.]|nr:HAD-IA family hydrolase [Methylophaga sp.]
MAYPLIVFDWDGTLMDSTGHIVFCMREAITKLEMPPLSDQQISHIIGLGLPEAVKTLYPQITAGDAQILVDGYRQIWLHHPFEAPLFDNAFNILKKLADQNVLLGVATGKSRRGLDKVLNETGLADLFVTTRCADECHSKPHPQMLSEIIDFCGVQTAETLMVGDTEFDLLMAKSAGADSVGIGHGAHDLPMLQACEPLAIVDDLFALESWLDRVC